MVAAYMLATCYSGSYTLAPLSIGTTYLGPNPSNSNGCQCSTIGYSLISACATCQDELTIYWSEYTLNCTSTQPPSQFPNPVPAGVYVPHWAILDVTSENIWNANESFAVGDNPEYGPGTIFGPSGVYTSPTRTSTANTSPRARPPQTRPPRAYFLP
ncbi:hypothetical protein BGY98DRAFT_372837 [Russula aff. rugulosa BPL654]|nr:hypothetical protein BGY98DRAFT_372837 [Russula aff. rugulosa BPL654]